MFAILYDTFSELLSRKALYIFIGITLIGMLMTLGTHSLSNQLGGGQGDAGEMTEEMVVSILKGTSWIAGLLTYLAIFLAAGQFPKMLIRGRADFYLSNPMSRPMLMLCKAFAVWLVYGGMVVISVIINYIFSGLIIGGLDVRILYVVAMNLVNFAVWVSIMVLIGIWTGSTGFSIVTVFVVMTLQSLLAMHENFATIINSKVANSIVLVLYYIFPKNTEIGEMANDLISGYPIDWLPLWSSLAFVALLFMISADIFKRKDY